MCAISPKTPVSRVQSDFLMFWLGQTISSLGSSFTSFALPLLVFKLTGSAINLGLAFVTNLLPSLFFGLLIGAWVDRVNRKRLMVVTDLLRALVIALLPLLALLGLLSIWWIYATLFLSSTLSICFDAASFAALPHLVGKDQLVKANGRLQASYSFANVIGPLLAGFLLIVTPLLALLLYDALSFLLSAGSLLLIRTSFNPSTARADRVAGIGRDIGEGLQYMLTHPVLRWLLLMLIPVNLIVPTIYAQFVFFAKQVLTVSDAQLGFLYAAGSIGTVAVSLAAGRLSKRVAFSKVALGSLMLLGLLTVGLAFTRWYWVALPLWAIHLGMSNLFNINAYSLGQSIVPDHLLGRVVSFVRVLAWSTTPLGALAGGVLIERTHNAALVYGWLGIVAFLIPFAFMFTPLGHIERIQPEEKPPSTVAAEESSP